MPRIGPQESELLPTVAIFPDTPLARGGLSSFSILSELLVQCACRDSPGEQRFDNE